MLLVKMFALAKDWTAPLPPMICSCDTVASGAQRSPYNFLTQPTAAAAQTSSGTTTKHRTPNRATQCFCTLQLAGLDFRENLPAEDGHKTCCPSHTSTSTIIRSTGETVKSAICVTWVIHVAIEHLMQEGQLFATCGWAHKEIACEQIVNL